MINLIKRYKSVILYLVFGGLTTLINIVTFWLCYSVLYLPNTVSNIIGWVLSVLFAFFTNKFFVFNSKSTEKKRILYEMFSFFSCRALTGVLDLGIMFLTVDILHYNALVMKILSNVIVIILNYVASKLFIFRSK